LPRYFFHIRSRDQLIKDSEGKELADPDAAHRWAVSGAGLIFPPVPTTAMQEQCFEIADANGVALFKVSFSNLLRISDRG
jgi:hypothetical protein